MFQIKKRMTSQIIQNYGQTLSVYVTASSLIHEPCDADVLRLVRECDLNVLVGDLHSRVLTNLKISKPC